MDSSDDDGIMDKLNGEKNKPLVFAKKRQLKDITESEFGQKVSDEVTVEDPIMDESSNQAENPPNLIPKTSTSHFATDLFERHVHKLRFTDEDIFQPCVFFA